MERILKRLAQRDQAKNVKNIAYGDLFAQIFCGKKPFSWCRFGAIPFIPVIGFACRAFGTLAMQIGYGLVIVLFVNYFLEDLL